MKVFPISSVVRLVAAVLLSSLNSLWAQAPSIKAQPLDQTVLIGNAATFGVEALGAEPLGYQWRKDGMNIPSATNANLTVTSVEKSDEGVYAVVVTNAAGSVVSFPRRLFVSRGTVVAWGYDGDGRTDVPPELNDVVAIAGGGAHSVALKNDGGIVAWGWNGSGQTNVPPGFSDAVSIAAGTSHTLALKHDGTVIAWGWNIFGQTNVPAWLTNVVAIAAGWAHSLALARDGTVVGWGWNGGGQTTLPAGLSNVVAIAAGEDHSLALKQSGIVLAWGLNGYGQINVPLGLTNVVAITAGAEHSLALKGDGTVIAWGGNSYGQTAVPAPLSNVVAITSGRFHSLAVKRNGTVVGWGRNFSGETNIPAGLSDVAAVAGGNSFSLALGNILPKYMVTVGTNGYGTVAISPLRPEYTPGEVVQIAARPARWHAFTQWNDGVTVNPRSIVVQSNSNFTAAFIPTSPLEMLEFGGVSRLAPVGMPAVFVNGVFIVETNVSARGWATVSLSTTLPSGALLFTQDGSDPGNSARLYDGPFVVRKSATLRAVAYNADFTQAVQSDAVEIIILPTLNATTVGGGYVALDPPAGAYWSNGTAVVIVTPEPGWTFLQWLGDATGTNPTASVSMSRNRCVQAVFGTALSNTVVGSGSVVRSPTADRYPYGTPVRLTAVPQAGNYFALWGNAASGTNNLLTFKVTNPNPTVTAVFAALPANQHALTVITDGFGEVMASPRANRYGNNMNVTLTAVPDADQSFLSWSGDASDTNNPLVVTMNQSKVITANFTKRPRLTPMLCDEAPNNEALQLLLMGEFGEPYVIEATANLVPGETAWTVVATVTNHFGSVQVTEPIVANSPRGFYRAVQAH